MKVATLGGGCFWCLEAVYDSLAGVNQVESGYAGGLVDNPSYQQVCTGKTGHAEVVQITYDPEVIRYEDILEIFFSVHDPTTLNRQGADVGTQYRSVIFYHNSSQRKRPFKLLTSRVSGRIRLLRRLHHSISSIKLKITTRNISRIIHCSRIVWQLLRRKCESLRKNF